MLAELLVAMGYPARYVTDPRDAVAVAMQYQPAAVLLDIGMPHLDGYQLLPMLRKALEPNRVPIIALTAWGTARDREYSHDSGFDDHLVKPASMESLRAALKKFLG
jgi:DNA-binding response OmpR family regulator